MIDLLHAEAMLTKAGQVEDIVSPKEIFKDYYILFLYICGNIIYEITIQSKRSYEKYTYLFSLSPMLSLHAVMYTGYIVFSSDKRPETDTLFKFP